MNVGALSKRIEPVVLCAQLASAFFDTGLQMVVKERCANATDAVNHTSTEDSRQRAMSNFYMTYNMLAKFTPIFPAIVLARIGDRGYRKVPIVLPLVGYLLSRTVLLLVVELGWPLEALYVAVVLHGLSGGFCSYWAGVMALVSLASAEKDRSLRMMHIELVYGLAGLVGSLASGHLFELYTATLKQGGLLVGLSVALYLGCLLYSTFVLQVDARAHAQTRGPVSEEEERPPGALGHNVRSLLIIGLLFAGAVLYDVAVGGGMEILVSFEMKEPLNWNATQVGYGNAAGFVVFLTSFLGVMVMSRCVSDEGLILIGMVSFSAGIYFMAFVTDTYMFYLARSLTLFALIPTPTIRSLLSKQVTSSSYGMSLISLQLSFKVASLVYTPVYTRIYQATLDWFPGLVFIMSSGVTVLAMVPIGVVGCILSQKNSYERLSKETGDVAAEVM